MRAALAALLLTGCAPEPPFEPEIPDELPTPTYLGIETVLLQEDLVQFTVRADPVFALTQLDEYGRCAAAQYALIRGFGFARHVRTTYDEEGGVPRADAVYVISPAIPRGPKTIDAETTVQGCADRGIPTV